MDYFYRRYEVPFPNYFGLEPQPNLSESAVRGQQFSRQSQSPIAGIIPALPRKQAAKPQFEGFSGADFQRTKKRLPCASGQVFEGLS